MLKSLNKNNHNANSSGSSWQKNAQTAKTRVAPSFFIIFENFKYFFLTLCPSTRQKLFNSDHSLKSYKQIHATGISISLALPSADCRWHEL